MMNSSTKNKIITAASVVFLIGIWQVGSIILDSDLILPSPSQTFLSVYELFVQPDFLKVIGTTILRGIIGFIISFFLALFLGIIAGIHEGFYAFLNPILVTIRSTPVISLILLALIWFDVNQVPVFIALLTMFPFICTNIIDGIRNVEKDLIEMAKVYKVKSNRIIKDIYLPGISPFIFSGVSSAMGFGWRAIIIGEVLSQPKYGIGTFMQNAQTYLLVDKVIGWTIIAILLSYMFEKIIRMVEKKIIVWK
ncbi:MAG: ABC transporter permease [Bacteroidales bacterium]